MDAASPVITGNAVVIDMLHPGIRIFASSHSDAEIAHLRSFGADMIVSGEQEIAQAMINATSLARTV